MNTRSSVRVVYVGVGSNGACGSLVFLTTPAFKPDPDRVQLSQTGKHHVIILEKLIGFFNSAAAIAAYCCFLRLVYSLAKPRTEGTTYSTCRELCSLISAQNLRFQILDVCWYKNTCSH